MKLCHENNGGAVYVGRGRDPAQSFVLTLTPQLNILTKHFDWSVAPTHSKFYCCLCRVKAKNANKNI